MTYSLRHRSSMPLAAVLLALGGTGAAAQVYHLAAGSTPAATAGPALNVPAPAGSRAAPPTDSRPTLEALPPEPLPAVGSATPRAASTPAASVPAAPSVRPPSAAGQGGTPAPSLAAEARAAVAAHSSYYARLRYQAEYFGESILGAGTYLESRAPQHGWRLELKSQVGRRAASLQQIGNERMAWVVRQLDTEVEVDQIDLRQLEQALGARFAPWGEVRLGPVGLGGLTGLLEALDAAFVFSAPVPGQGSQGPVLAAEGTWRPAALAAQIPAHAEALAAGRSIPAEAWPPQLPERVRLEVTADGRLPARIEFLGRPRAAAGDGGASGLESRLTLEWFEVQFDLPVDPNLFEFHPGPAPVRNLTDHILARLRQQAPERTAPVGALPPTSSAPTERR